jgi:hypothetical protein
VGYPAGQGPDGLQFLGLTKLLFERNPGLLGLLPLGNVLREPLIV